MNGTVARHDAQDESQQTPHDVYDLAKHAVVSCLGAQTCSIRPSLLVMGATYSPLLAPGTAAILHSRLRDTPAFDHPTEISSHGGICSSSAAALVGAIRAVKNGDQ